MPHRAVLAEINLSLSLTDISLKFEFDLIWRFFSYLQTGFFSTSGLGTAPVRHGDDFMPFGSSDFR